MTSTHETWRAVVGYEGLYEVSDQGRVRSLPRIDAQGGRRRLRVHKPSRMDAHGHLGVKLRKDGVVRSRYVHHVVLEAFVGPRQGAMVACHWNDDPEDNRLANLRWASSRDNRIDILRNGNDHNVNKKHCPRGHPYSPENTRIYAGRRHCQSCAPIYQATYRAKRAAMRRKAS